MSQRILRTVPMAVLMTTALAWNLPAAAQAIASPPPAVSAGPAQKAPPGAGVPAARDGAKAAAATPAAKDERLPADLRPALPPGASEQAAPAEAASDRVSAQPVTPKQ